VDGREGREPSRPLPTPPVLRRRWLDAGREEVLVRVLKGLGVLVALGLVALLALNWWIVRAYLTGPEQALADVCRGSIFADAPIVAAGGPDVIDVPDHEVLAPYREAPDRRRRDARRIRDHASLRGDDDLAVAATETLLQGPFPGRHALARVEVGCQRAIDAVDADAADAPETAEVG
jgi:hypothetical protein